MGSAVVAEPGRPLPEESEKFAELSSWFGWWDRPLGGVVPLRGRPHYFVCEFSEVLDDYEDFYKVWPVPSAALDLESEWWLKWCEWRSAFDRNESPRPIEEDPNCGRLEQALRGHREPPTTATLLRAEWLLDENRSYAQKAPTHRVRWRH